jgi:hypothetical protein
MPYGVFNFDTFCIILVDIPRAERSFLIWKEVLRLHAVLAFNPCEVDVYIFPQIQLCMGGIGRMLASCIVEEMDDLFITIICAV